MPVLHLPHHLPEAGVWQPGICLAVAGPFHLKQEGRASLELPVSTVRQKMVEIRDVGFRLKKEIVKSYQGSSA